MEAVAPFDNKDLWRAIVRDGNKFTIETEIETGASLTQGPFEALLNPSRCLALLEGMTPLHGIVCSHKQWSAAFDPTYQSYKEAVERLVRASPKECFERIGPDGNTVLLAYCKLPDDYINMRIFNKILRRTPKHRLDEAGVEGKAALWIALAQGRSMQMSALLQAGADPNATDTHGNTALHFACAKLSGVQFQNPKKWNLLDVVKRLLKAGAKIDQPNHDGALAMHLAPTLSPLIWAKLGADINATDNAGRGLAWYALQRGKEGIDTLATLGQMEGVNWKQQLGDPGAFLSDLRTIQDDLLKYSKRAQAECEQVVVQIQARVLEQGVPEGTNTRPRVRL